MKNQTYKVRPETININSNEPVFFPFSIKTSKCSGSCNNINDPYTKIYVPDAAKDLNIQVFNLTSKNNETRHIKWHETCKCKCSLDTSVCNNKKRWNNDKCWCKCKELIDKGVCDKENAWYPSNCECECDKSCDLGEYLDYENCKCKKQLVDKLVEECNENIDEEKWAEIDLFEHKNECVCYYTVFIVLGVIFLTICIGIGVYFTEKYKNCNEENVAKYDYVYQVANYLI